jgi:hypothetical protein
MENEIPKQEETKALNKAHVIGSFSVIQTLQFAEWIGLNYVRLHECWVHRYADQRNKDNWKDTGELFGYWMENCR